MCPDLLIAQKKLWSLNECIEQAWQKNIALNQQKWNNEINKINYQQSKDNRLPDLNLNDVHSINYGKYLSSSTGEYINQNFSTNNLVLSSSVILFNGLQYQNLIKGNRLTYESGELDIEIAKNELGLNVIAAYMQVLFEYEAVNIAQSQIDATKEQVDRTKKYVAAGQLPELNLLQIQAQLAADNANKVSAQNQLQLAKVGLMQLMEIPVTDDFDIAKEEIKDIAPVITISPADIYNTAIGLLPDVKSATMKTDAANYGLKTAKGTFLPKLTLSGNLNTSYSGLNSLYTTHTYTEIENIGYLQSNPSELVVSPVPVTTTTASNYPFFRQYGDNFGQNISINLSIPIFSNFVSRHNVSKAKIAVVNAQLNESAVKNQIRKSIEQAYTDQVAASKNYFAAMEQQNAEERAYRDMELKFMHGIANTTDFLVEKANYNRSLIATLQAKYQYVFKTRIVNFYITNSLIP